MMEQTEYPMQLYTGEGFEGYAGTDIEAYLLGVYGRPRVADFRNWINGQTMVGIERDGYTIGIVYRWDFERYMARLPVID